MIYRRRERTSPYIKRAGEFLSLTPPCNEKEKTERETEPVAVKREREGDEDAQPPNAKREQEAVANKTRNGSQSLERSSS
jgi:hypothetical protein